MRRNLFDDVVVDPEVRGRYLAGQRAGQTYVIHFTPRSGSSWLGDVVSKTNALGTPEEFFNPNFVPNIANVFNVSTLDDYIEVLLRRRGVGGIFGFEITHHQIIATFGSADAFLERFGAARPLWLIREDIALQAVSLFKMVHGQVSHRTSTADDTVRAADATLSYDNDELVRWLRHIWKAEIGTEEVLARTGQEVLRLSYERNVATDTLDLVNRIAAHVGRPPVPGPLAASGHDKIGTARNAEWADELRQRNAALFDTIDEERATRLALLG